MSSIYQKALTLCESFLSEEGWERGEMRPNDSGYLGNQTLFTKDGLSLWVQDITEWPDFTFNMMVGKVRGWPEDIMIYHNLAANTAWDLRDFLIENGIQTRSKCCLTMK